ncbi:MAG: hypothetical protein U9Q79_11490, partial [Candidatus Hydrogenedentes bacterium]|nr:hypothetical protein [Candidatus Hydrogenedentota bacterium]
DVVANETEPLSYEAGAAFYNNREIFGAVRGLARFGPYGILGPTSATPDGNLLVGGVGVIEVVQPEGGFLRRDGRVFKTVDFGTELLYLPISVDGKILVADSSGVGQEATAEVDPGFLAKLFAPIIQLLQWLLNQVLGLFGLAI